MADRLRRFTTTPRGGPSTTLVLTLPIDRKDEFDEKEFIAS